MNGQTNRWIDERMGRQIDGQTKGWADRWGQTNELKERFFILFISFSPPVTVYYYL